MKIEPQGPANLPRPSRDKLQVCEFLYTFQLPLYLGIPT